MRDRPTPTSAALLWATCVVTALTVSLLAQSWTRGPKPLPVESSPSLAPNLRQLERQLAGLEARVARLQERALETPPPPGPPIRTALTGKPEGASSANRLRDLEERLARLESARPPAVARRLVSEPSEPPESPAEAALRRATRLAADRARVLDPTASDSERAFAWMNLRDAAEPWTDDLVLTMIDIGSTSADDRAREVVWIGAESEHRSELLVQPLIQALLSDPVADVREEAADALSQYLHAPGVRHALLTASREDPSAKVREEALKALRSED